MSPSRPGRPLKGATKRTRVSFTLDPARYQQLREKAFATGISPSELLDQAIDRLTSDTALDRTLSARLPWNPDWLQKFCARHHILALRVFGSALTRNFSASSDIDLLAEFSPEESPGFWAVAQMESELSKAAGGRKIDFRTAGELSPYFRDEVQKKARVIYRAA